MKNTKWRLGAVPQPCLYNHTPSVQDNFGFSMNNWSWVAKHFTNFVDSVTIKAVSHRFSNTKIALGL